MLKKRLLKAQELLKEEFLSMDEISVACGYKDVSNFSRAFKKFYGVTPRSMRHS